MWEEIGKVLINYGLSGIAIAALAWWVYRSDKDVKKERAEWRETVETQFKKITEVAEGTADDRQNYVTLLTEIKTLLGTLVQSPQRPKR